MKWNLQTVVMEGRDRLSHPLGDDAVSTLREATRDKPTTTKVKVLGGGGGGSSLISWEWFKYQCRKNPDLFLSFFSNRWLCCVVARTVNVKHLRVNDRKRYGGENRAGLYFSIAPGEFWSSCFREWLRCLKKKKKIKQKSFRPGLILFFFFLVHSRLHRQTPPCCPPLVQEKERRPPSERDRKQMQHKTASQIRGRGLYSLLDEEPVILKWNLWNLRSTSGFTKDPRGRHVSLLKSSEIGHSERLAANCFSGDSVFSQSGSEGQLGLAAKSSLACPHTWLVCKVWVQHFALIFCFSGPQTACSNITTDAEQTRNHSKFHLLLCTLESDEHKHFNI